MLGVSDGELFPYEDATDNPAYGVNLTGRTTSQSSSGTGSVGSDDYLSVSVNPNYQFMGHVAQQIVVGDHVTVPKNAQTSKASSVGFDLDRHLNGAVPIPAASGAPARNGGHLHLEEISRGGSYKLSSTPSYPLSSSAPPNTTSPTDLLLPHSLPDHQSTMSSITESHLDSPSAVMEDEPYSYAQHCRTPGLLPSNYSNSPHALIEKRPHHYVPNPVNDFHPTSSLRSRGMSSSVEDSMSKLRSNMSRSLRYRRDRHVPHYRFEFMIGLFSILVIIVSIVAIALSVVIMFGGNTTTTSSSRLNNNGGQVIVIDDQSSPTGSSPVTGQPATGNNICNCPVPKPNNTQFNSLLEQLTLFKNTLNLLRNQPSKLNTSLNQLSTYLSQIKAINNSLQQLRPAANTPKEPVLTGLNLPTDITINHGDCFDEIFRCTATGFFRRNDQSFISVGYCQTPDRPFSNETHVTVSNSCVVKPASGTVLTEPTGAFIKVVRNTKILSSTFSCYCLNYNRVVPECYMHAKRCSYQLGTVTATLSVHS